MFRIFLSSAKLNFQPEAAACVQTGNSTAFLLRTESFSLVAAHRVQEAELGRRQVLGVLCRPSSGQLARIPHIVEALAGAPSVATILWRLSSDPGDADTRGIVINPLERCCSGKR